MRHYLFGGLLEVSLNFFSLWTVSFLLTWGFFSSGTGVLGSSGKASSVRLEHFLELLFVFDDDAALGAVGF